jgi:hypothetical protein
MRPGYSIPLSLVILLEVKIGQIHVTAGQYVNGEDILSFAEMKLE